MGFISWIKKVINKIVWVPCDPGPKHLGMTKSGYFIAVLNACPNGSKVFLDECQADSWIEVLRPWSRTEKLRFGEENYYLIDDQLKKIIIELIRCNPKDLDYCHSIYIESADGKLLFLNHDYFRDVELADEIKQALKSIAD